MFNEPKKTFTALNFDFSEPPKTFNEPSQPLHNDMKNHDVAVKNKFDAKPDYGSGGNIFDSWSSPDSKQGGYTPPSHSASSGSPGILLEPVNM